MFTEAFPRLAISLRSTFPEAIIGLVEQNRAIEVSFRNYPNRPVIVEGLIHEDQYQTLRSSILLVDDGLQNIPREDFYDFLAIENRGLRGATLIPEMRNGRQCIRVVSSFMARKGRSRDEAENLAIDVLSLLRFTRLLEDRINRSSVPGRFSLEMYSSLYGTGGSQRCRYINYARSIFNGSTERVFGQVLSMLKSNYKYRIAGVRGMEAVMTSTISPLQLTLKIPLEIPMITLSTTLRELETADLAREQALKLNAKTRLGHFENRDREVVFTSWKHLTNDLRFYSLDQLVNSLLHAETLLENEVMATLDTRLYLRAA